LCELDELDLDLAGVLAVRAVVLFVVLLIAAI
jgi:hypothetical protein